MSKPSNPMRICCSTLTFCQLPLEQALKEIAGMGFTRVDLALHEGWAHLNPSRLARDAEEGAGRVQEACERMGLTVAAFNVGLGHASMGEVALRLGGVLKLARLLNVPVVTFPCSKTGSSFDLEVDRWQGVVQLAKGFGITATIEPHIGQMAEHPDVAAALCRGASGLKITLDPSHLLAGPHQGPPPDSLYQHVAHVHLRDAGKAGWREIQVPMGQGRMDIPGILRALSAAGYEGELSTEYIHGLHGIDARKETMALKQVVERTLQG